MSTGLLPVFDISSNRETGNWKNVSTRATATNGPVASGCVRSGFCRFFGCIDQTCKHYLLENGIPFHTLQLSTTLSWSSLSTHPPLILPSCNADYVFSLQDYEIFRQHCHVIFKQPHGRAALLRGYYPWRLAMNNVGFSSILSGPSGLSTNPEEMLIVKVLETGEEFINDSWQMWNWGSFAGSMLHQQVCLLLVGVFNFTNNFTRYSRSTLMAIMVSSNCEVWAVWQEHEEMDTDIGGRVSTLQCWGD